MSFAQTYAVECGDHTFDFTIDREAASLMEGRGYEGDINGVTCPTCGKIRAISFKELVKQRKKAESEEHDQARADAEAELLVAAGGDKKKIRKREMDALTEQKVRDRVKARGPLGIAKGHAKEKNTAATWTDNSRGHADHGGGPPVAPDTEGVIDSTG